VPAAEDLEPYLVPTWFIDCDTPGVRHRAEEVAVGATSDEERATRLFYAVRDGIRYDPYSVTSDRDDYRSWRSGPPTAFPRPWH